jgi:hypothetical protein
VSSFIARTQPDLPGMLARISNPPKCLVVTWRTSGSLPVIRAPRV